jgi:DNA-binding transcriptional regulator LsrR (DeoR family)
VRWGRSACGSSALVGDWIDNLVTDTDTAAHLLAAAS